MTDLPDNPKPKVGTGSIMALAPTTIDETFRLAQALSRSGDMVPKHFQAKPEATMAAIVRGMELGLAPMQALSNITVINGRASLWGDAVPAIIQQAGHSIDVVVEGEGESMVATATLERGDTGKKTVRTFSVDDAKKAGLWGKQGPWQTYPKRMLMHRARAWAARDGAADALMGLQVAEEMSDMRPMRDVTPRDPERPTLAQQITQQKPDPEPEPDEQSQDTGSDGHWTDDIDTSEAFPGDDAFDEGVKAHKAGEERTNCPHSDHTIAAQWLGGWDQAEKFAQGEEAEA